MRYGAVITAVIAVFDSDKLSNIVLEDIPKIDRNAPTKKASTGNCDMGQDILYVVDRDGELINLRSEGDWNSYLDDPTAKKLCEFYDFQKTLDKFRKR